MTSGFIILLPVLWSFLPEYTFSPVLMVVNKLFLFCLATAQQAYNRAVEGECNFHLSVLPVSACCFALGSDSAHKSCVVLVQILAKVWTDVPGICEEKVTISKVWLAELFPHIPKESLLAMPAFFQHMK